MKVPLFKPFVGDDELSSLKEIFKTGWIGLGPRTAEFEKRFEDYLDVEVCIGTNSATSALDLSLKIFNFDQGEILVPGITFASTAQVVDYSPQLSAKFVDVDQETLCMDMKDLESKISKNTRAIMPVHMGGHACDMDKIFKIIEAKSLDVKVIEDCAHCLGGEYKGKKLGTIGDIGCFSFEAKKNITTGDGGMLVTSHKSIESKLRRLRWVGMNKDTWKRISTKESYSWYYDIDELGYKYNMNDIMASMGIVQLKKLDKINEKKRYIMKKYNEGLSSVKGISVPKYYDLETGAHWLYIIKAEKRDELVDFLAKKGITTGVHYMPLNLHPYYKRNYPTSLPVSEKVWLKLISLPLFFELTDEMIDYVIDTIKEF